MGIEDPIIKSGHPVKQFSLMLENRIGAMHSIIKLLGDSNILVLGLSVQDSFDVNVPVSYTHLTLPTNREV